MGACTSWLVGFVVGVPFVIVHDAMMVGPASALAAALGCVVTDSLAVAAGALAWTATAWLMLGPQGRGAWRHHAGVLAGASAVVLFVTIVFNAQVASSAALLALCLVAGTVAGYVGADATVVRLPPPATSRSLWPPSKRQMTGIACAVLLVFDAGCVVMNDVVLAHQVNADVTAMRRLLDRDLPLPASTARVRAFLTSASVRAFARSHTFGVPDPADISLAPPDSDGQERVLWATLSSSADHYPLRVMDLRFILDRSQHRILQAGVTESVAWSPGL